MPVERPARPWLWALLGLVAIHGLTFASHYQGQLTFPWDFVGGYHAHTYAWYAQGGMLNPPRWFPWGDGGFPAFLALQSGAWYLPLEALRLFGVPYDVINATRMQCAHVLFGAIGALCLLRSLGLGWGAAFVGSVCWHFSATFFSNQQHVDIVRGAAWLPWVLLVTSPAFVLARRLAPVLSALVLFQFGVAAYPGIVVAAAYGVAIWVALLGWHIGFDRWRQWAPRLAAAVFAAALMAALKFLPLLTHGDLVPREALGVTSMRLELMATLLMPYDASFLSGDITMRSLWLPTVAVVAAAFGAGWPAAIGWALAVAAVVFGAQPLTEGIDLRLPGMAISRFPISDWRPVLHIGLIIVAGSAIHAQIAAAGAAAATAASSPGAPRRIPALRLAVLGLVGGATAWVLHGLGYSIESLLWAGAFALATVAALLMLPLRSGALARLPHALPGLVMLALLTAANGYWFHRWQSLPWRAPWSASLEAEAFGVTPSYRARQPQQPPARRPARLLLHAEPAEALRSALNARYNICWYSASYCAFGYNNLNLSAPHRALKSKVAEAESGGAVLKFLQRQQQLAVLQPQVSFDARALPDDDQSGVISAVSGVAVNFLSYGSDVVRYEIHAPSALRVVENEMWASGWAMRFCDEAGCRRGHVGHTAEYFRSWELPAGTWRVELQYGRHLYRWPALLALVGLVGVVAVSLARRWWQPRPT